jgi:hypothetical protein
MTVDAASDQPGVWPAQATVVDQRGPAKPPCKRQADAAARYSNRTLPGRPTSRHLSTCQAGLFDCAQAVPMVCNQVVYPV